MLLNAVKDAIEILGYTIEDLTPKKRLTDRYFFTINA